MSEPKNHDRDRLSNDEYQILFFEIQQAYLVEQLAFLLNKSEAEIAAFYGSHAIDVINDRSIDVNRDCVSKLRILFAEKVMDEFNE